MAPRRAQQKREVLAFAHPGKHESSIVIGNCCEPTNKKALVENNSNERFEVLIRSQKLDA